MKEIRITPEEFEKTYREHSNVKAARIIGISPTTLIKEARKKGIALKGQGRKPGQTKLKFI